MLELPERNQITKEILLKAYEIAATRYNNIYQSVWTIFSYMSAVSGFLLAFGSSRITPEAVGWLGSLPLLFWFWSTYLPLDRYGNGVLRQLGRIERELQDRFGVPVGHFEQFADRKSGLWPEFSRQNRKLKEEKAAGSASNEKPRRHLMRRARFAICISFVVLHLVFFWTLLNWYRYGNWTVIQREAPAPLFEMKFPLSEIR